MNQIQEAEANRNLQGIAEVTANNNHLKCSVCWEASCLKSLQVAVTPNSAWSVGFLAPDSRLGTSHSSELPGLAETTNKILRIIKLIVYSNKKNNAIKKVTETEQFFRGNFNSVAALMIPLL